MKKLLSIGITAVVLLAMVLTCPKEEAHKEAIGASYKEKLQDKLGLASGLIGKKTLQKWANNTVAVNDYLLFSVGTYSMNDGNAVVSVGLFNHVFTFTKDDVLEEFGRSLGLNN